MALKCEVFRWVFMIDEMCRDADVISVASPREGEGRHPLLSIALRSAAWKQRPAEARLHAAHRRVREERYSPKTDPVDKRNDRIGVNRIWKGMHIENR